MPSHLRSHQNYSSAAVFIASQYLAGNLTLGHITTPRSMPKLAQLAAAYWPAAPAPAATFGDL